MAVIIPLFEKLIDTIFTHEEACSIVHVEHVTHLLSPSIIIRANIY